MSWYVANAVTDEKTQEFDIYYSEGRYGQVIAFQLLNSDLETSSTV